MRKIAVALDKIQAETCTISEATEIWLNLSEDVKEGTFTQQEIQSFQNRYDTITLLGQLIRSSF